MAKKPRIHFPGAFYHVIARGNRGQKIFPDDEDYERYLSFLKEYKARFRFLLPIGCRRPGLSASR